MAEINKIYLGDSVYAEIEGDPFYFQGVTLTTWNGYGNSNTIVLEPEVFFALKQFVERKIEAQAEARDRREAEAKSALELAARRARDQ